VGGVASEKNGKEPEQLKVEILAEHPWDKTSFTQGLEVVEDGKLLVGTGMKGKSRIYHTTIDDQQTNNEDLAGAYFGEGVTRHVGPDGRAHVWQLSWQENTAFLRDATSLKKISTETYEGEGWGLCSDGNRLVMSDGSGTLSFRDPATFAKTGSVDVTLNGEPTDMLNELDCDPTGGPDDSPAVWANVWQTDDIYRIDPSTGEVTGVVDAKNAFGAADKPGADVLNGIAKIPGTDKFYVTGKYWDTLYEVRFIPANA